ncbi:hypothetical protein ACGFIF_00195 [Kribbella sp. NPDC049174]|uniref:hypothetical protein n=1 Tax=Kribbella sp. NPDC049174 TaxID=3364112 RepID=UPI0037118CAD
MGGSTRSPMGKTYLSTAVTEDGRPKQLVSNTRIRLEFAEVPNLNDEGPRVYDVLRAHAGCNRIGAASRPVSCWPMGGFTTSNRDPRSA